MSYYSINLVERLSIEFIEFSKYLIAYNV